MSGLIAAPAAGLLEPAVAARLALALGGQAQEVRIPLGSLAPGQVGVVRGVVRSHGIVQAFTRKRGGDGLLQRVTLADATGEADIVLWDDELRLAQDGPLRVGAHVILRGPTIRHGGDGRMELGVSGAAIEAVPAPPPRGFTGRLLSMTPAKAHGPPPNVRFEREATVQTPRGLVRVHAWDEAARQLQGLPLGADVHVQGQPDPLLDLVWSASGIVRAAPGPAPHATPDAAQASGRNR